MIAGSEMTQKEETQVPISEISSVSLPSEYAYTGYGVSSPGIQNYKFLLKNLHTQRKLLNNDN